MPSDEHCFKPTSGDNTVSLWDGESYCEACVAAVSPALVKYAKSHDTLQETAPFDQRSQWRNAFRMEALIFLLFGAFFVTAGYIQWGPVGLAFGAGITLVICSIQAAIQLPMFVAMGRHRLPTVVVRDGRIECFRGGKKTHFCRSMPLREIKWRLGKSRQDSGLRNTFVQRQQIVLLILPYLPNKVARLSSLGKERYACGWSSEMMHIWQSFFTLAAVPKER